MDIEFDPAKDAINVTKHRLSLAAVAAFELSAEPAKKRCAVMRKIKPPVDFDENPEWTAEDFAHARPAAEILPPEVLATFGKGKRGRPVGWTKPNAKKAITLRHDRDVIEGWRLSGPGWQSRMNAALRGLWGGWGSLRGKEEWIFLGITPPAQK